MAEPAASTTTGQGAGANRQLGIFLLIGLSMGWGFNWPFLKIVVSEIPIWQFRTVTTTLAALAMLAMARAMGLSMRIPREHYPILVVAALFNITSWHALIAYGVTLLNAGQAAIVAFTMPVWAAILGAIFLKERLTLRRVSALVLGIAAVLILVWGDLTKTNASPLGIGVMLIAAFNWAVGTIIQKRVKWTISSIPLAGWQLLIGVIPIAVMAFTTETWVWHKASWSAIGAATYLTCIAMVFCYYAWFRIVTIFPASVAAIGTLMIPVLGLLSGAVMLGEGIGWQEGAAVVLVTIALSLVLIQPAPGRAR